MHRCLELARKGLGTTRPNPSVGAVLVVNHKIIGEGFTDSYGGKHAEVRAIESVKNVELLKKATLYVTLEPCSHFGKTPPCSDLIIQMNIPKVIVGCIDDNPMVGGKGVEKLRNAGIEVEVGVLENECKNHHRRFFTFYNKKRPYIILKWAQTKDGFIAPNTKTEQKPIWISNLKSRQLTHQWRAEEHAILVGKNTVIQDNPSLTVREVKGENPIRIVLAKEDDLSHDFNVFTNEAETIVLNESSVDKILLTLYKRNIQSVIVEGGAKILQLFIDSGLWDEARVFVGNVEFGEGLNAPKLGATLKTETKIMDDVLKFYYND